MSSAKSAKKSTTKTRKLTPGQELEILQTALSRCQEAGVELRLAPFYDGGYQSVVIVLENVGMVDGNLCLAEAASTG